MRERNILCRTNNTLVEKFQVNSLNELTTNTNGGRLTVVGTTISPATNVTVNGTNALRYGDATFAATNMPLTTNYTAVAQDSYGRRATNTATVSISTNVTFQYDGNGNLTNDGLRNFVYDDENQLIQVSVSNAWMSQFAYDGKMRRRIRQEFTWQGGAWLSTNTVYYVYDGNLVIQERDVNNLPTVTYTRGKDLSGSLDGAGGIGGLLARTAQAYQGAPVAGHSFYHSDGNGNVTMLIDSYQGIVAHYLYDAFGNMISKSGLLADANVYRFSSKEWHQNSGLVYYLYRYYAPNLQRWPNRDPKDELGFEQLRNVIVDTPASGVNLYTFVYNDAVDIVDPLGLAGFGSWSIQDLQAIINNLSQAMERLPVGSPEWQSAYAQRALLYRQLHNLLLRQAALRFAGRVCLVAGAGIAGYEGGTAIGNATPYQGGGTINQNVMESFVPFWNWWYGFK